MKTQTVVLALAVAMVTVSSVQGHGYMKDPPARQTLKNPASGITDCATGGATDWTPSGLFCGGAGVQAGNGGKCGACGDDFAATYPRDHDLGGAFVKQLTFSRAYLQGQTITVTVDITAAHKGAFEVRLCPFKEGTQGPDDLTQCYMDPDAHYVLRSPTGDLSTAVSATGMYYMEVTLPAAVNCEHGCNMQWWYRTGNSWGCNEIGQCELGLGDQEHFVNCADVLILNCAQYNAMKDDPIWCGKGPTPELANCAFLAPNPSDTGAGGTNPDSGVGITADGGATDNTANGGATDNTADGGATDNTADGDVTDNNADGGASTADGGAGGLNSDSNTGPVNPTDEDDNTGTSNKDTGDCSKSDSASSKDGESASSKEPSSGNTDGDNKEPSSGNTDGDNKEPSSGNTDGDTKEPSSGNTDGDKKHSTGSKTHPGGEDSGPFAKLPASWIPTDPVTDMSCEQCYATGYDFCDTCCIEGTVKEFKGTQQQFDAWCESTCPIGDCPASHCKVITHTKVTKICRLPGVNSGDVNVADDVKTDVKVEPIMCDDCTEMDVVTCPNDCCRKSEVESYKGRSPRFNRWCKNNCARGNCPTSHCVTSTVTSWEDVCRKVFRKLIDDLAKLDKAQTRPK